MIVRSEVAIMFLNRCHFITEPDGDLVNAFSSGNLETGKRVPHRMRYHPLASLRAHVLREGCSEIVTIKPFSMGHVGPKHERITKTVGLEKRLKLDCERNRTFFTIFKIHGGRFAQMQITGLEIKPERPCFDDLLEPQTGVESAEKDETQLLSGRFSNQPVAKVVRAKILAGTSNGPRYLHILHRIATGDSSGLNLPSGRTHARPSHIQALLCQRCVAGRRRRNVEPAAS